MYRCIVLYAILGICRGHFLSNVELLKFHTELNVTSTIEDPSHRLLANRKPVNSGLLPIYFDWRYKGVVTPVKNQLGCTACWAFSIIAAIESHVAIHTNVKEIMSEQFLIDCDFENKGCGVASLLESYSHIVNQIGGVLRDQDYYPYEGQQNACRWCSHGSNSSRPLKGLVPGSWVTSYANLIPIIGYIRVKPDEEEMAQALYRYGPITAALNSASMATYTGGIDDPTDIECDPTKPDHTVLIVGYNVYVPNNPRKPSVKYWIIKNSWGDQWGDNGFYYLVRGRNACGIRNDVSLPFVAT